MIKEEEDKAFIGATLSVNNLKLIRKIARFENMYSGPIGYDAVINYEKVQTLKYEYHVHVGSGLLLNGENTSIYDLYHDQALTIIPYTNLKYDGLMNITSLSAKLLNKYETTYAASREYKAILDFNKLSKTKNYVPVLFNDYDIYQIDTFDVTTKEHSGRAIMYGQTSSYTRIKFLETDEESPTPIGYSPNLHLEEEASYKEDYLKYLNDNISKVMTTFIHKETNKHKNSAFEYETYGPWFPLFTENFSTLMENDMNISVFKDLGYNNVTIEVVLTASSSVSGANMGLRLIDEGNFNSPFNHGFKRVVVSDKEEHTFTYTLPNVGYILDRGKFSVDHNYKSNYGLIRTLTIHAPQIITITLSK